MDSPLLLIVLAVFFTYYLITVLYLSRAIARPELCDAAISRSVSVIVAARNEADTIEGCLRSLIAQHFPRNLLEIIIVDDRSEDATGEIVARWSARYPHLKQIRITQTVPGFGPKKAALAEGVKHSRGELLLFTDADCRPPRRWIAKMAACFSPRVGLVAGFAPLRSERGGIWGRIVEFDALVSAAVASTGIGTGTPITCTGRNLAYRRQVYDEVNGFDGFKESFAGDDDLFMFQVARRTSWHCFYSMDADTFVPSAAPATLGAFIRQRRRHIASSRYYPRSVKAGYFLTYLSNFALFVFFLQSMVTGFLRIQATTALLIKLGVDIFLLARIAKAFKRTFSLTTCLLWECYFVLMYTVLGPLSFIGGVRWR